MSKYTDYYCDKYEDKPNKNYKDLPTFYYNIDYIYWPNQEFAAKYFKSRFSKTDFEKYLKFIKNNFKTELNSMA